MTALEVLTRARAFIADESRWCQGESVIGEDGRAHLALWPDPAKCCAYGAMAYVSGDFDPPGWRELWDACGDDPIKFNDSHKHAEVLDAFDRAILPLSTRD